MFDYLFPKNGCLIIECRGSTMHQITKNWLGDLSWGFPWEKISLVILSLKNLVDAQFS